jgi:GNAT superfamily N-acetyltransferase
MSLYTIRLARRADIPRIREMQERSISILGGNFYTPHQIGNFVDLFGTMDDTLVDEGHYFVAEGSSGAILGSGGWTYSQPSYANAMVTTERSSELATVRSVFVDPTATRRGIASAIMRRTEGDALDHRVGTLHLTATLSGVALYRALGYQIVRDAELRFPDRSSFECVRMCKALDGRGGALYRAS